MDRPDAFAPWREGLVLWEWRTFGAVPRESMVKIRSLPLLRLERLADEYIRLPGRLDTNVKLRSGGLKLKRLLDEAEGAQAWVHLELDLPVSFARLAELLELGPAGAPALGRGACVDASEVLEAFRAACGGRASLVRLAKERRSHLFRDGWAGCEVETADLVLAGTRSLTVAVTGGDAGAVRAAVNTLGLTGCRASDYPNFIEGAMAQLHRQSHESDG
ncbi:MAG: hypothetical protein HY721_13640 [Planctomycetes bacterium]|nr:hypothetical protein [Planctomycetota bacterium]